MHIDIVPNRGSTPTVLLRESYREGGKVRKRTLANLTALPAQQVDLMRRVLKGEQLSPATEALECIQSRPHGHVEAVRRAMRQLGFENLIASRPSPERDRVCAMVAAQILEPNSKLSMTRWWGRTTLAQEFHVEDVTEDGLYAAMDWLLERQATIERKLADRHLREGGLVLYDLSSSYVYGETCPLADFGYSRDGKPGKRQINYGLLTNNAGIPVAVSVFKGNTADANTVLEQADKIRLDFGITEMVLVGDRGMLSNKNINGLRERGGFAWITALKARSIQKLLDQKFIQLGLFDERNLFEFTHPDYPDERLIACRNPELAKRKAHARSALIEATEKRLDFIRQLVTSGKLRGKAAIGVRAGKVLKRDSGKYFDLTIEDGSFKFAVNQSNVDAEAALDGLYVIRTSVPAVSLDTDGAVRSYKMLSRVERAFRSMKSIDLEVRPIRHHLENRVRAHIFICMLAYYVTRYMREAWRPLCFAAETPLGVGVQSDPVAPAKRAESALEKTQTQRLPDGTLVHSFRDLLKVMAGVVRNTCRCPGHETTFMVTTSPDQLQQRALTLLDQVGV